MKKQIYTFLGLPAAGKGTQAQIFAEKHGYEIVGIGDLVRDAIKNGDPSDPEIKKIIDKYNDGKPVEDDSVFKLVAKKLEEFKTATIDGILFDNFPMFGAQADFVSEYIAENEFEKLTVVNVKIAPETAVERIAIRKICPKCKSIYAGDVQKCEKCGEELISRADDNVETIKKRIAEYQPQIDKMLEYFKTKGRVIEINGEKSVEEVTDEINAKL